MSSAFETAGENDHILSLDRTKSSHMVHGNTMELSDEDRRALRLELASCEALLSLVHDRFSRNVLPGRPPSQLQRDAQAVAERVAVIRKLLGT